MVENSEFEYFAIVRFELGTVAAGCVVSRLLVFSGSVKTRFAEIIPGFCSSLAPTSPRGPIGPARPVRRRVRLP